MTNQSDLPIQTLRLSDRDKAKLLWAIEQANQQDDGKSQRRLRVNCSNKEAVLTMRSDVISDAKLAVLVRNLSRRGTALVHGRYVHPNSKCIVTLADSAGVVHDMLGTVRHIRHIQGTIHELGVAFEDPIDLREFVGLSPSEESRYLSELADDLPEQTEETAVVKIASRVLVVDDFDSDRKLIGHWLTEAGLSATCVGAAREALLHVKEKTFDLLVVNDKLGPTKGKDLIQAFRQIGYTGPVIAVSADESEEVQATLLESGADRFLKKPFTPEVLAETVSELIGLGVDDDTEPIVSTQQDDEGMRPLLTEFTRGLAGTIETLRAANAQRDHDTLQTITHQLKGVGNGYGFPVISDKAADVLGSLNDSGDELETIRASVAELIAILNRIKTG